VPDPVRNLVADSLYNLSVHYDSSVREERNDLIQRLKSSQAAYFLRKCRRDTKMETQNLQGGIQAITSYTIEGGDATCDNVSLLLPYPLL